MSIPLKFVLTIGLIAVATLAGYLARRSGRIPEQAARWTMSFVMVLGYTSIGFLSVWQMRLEPADVWLPVLAAIQVLVMLPLSLGIGRLVGRDRQEVGLCGITAPWGNTGFTMGGFIIYLLYGVEGLGLVSVYGLMWTPVTVLVMYPIARHFSDDRPTGPLTKLMLRNLLDWRSVGLPIIAAAIVLSVSDVPPPAFLARYPVIDAGMFAVIFIAYFSIGLRLRVSYVWPLKRMILGVSAGRFVLGAATGIALETATWLTPWPVRGTSWDVFVIESFVPGAITTVAVANMFHLRPRESSVLFVATTAIYLALILPAVLAIFGR